MSKNPDVLVRVLSASRFSGVEGGGQGSQPWRCWWNGRVSGFYATKQEAEERFKAIKRRGWA